MHALALFSLSTHLLLSSVVVFLLIQKYNWSLDVKTEISCRDQTRAGH